jgi:hypothetical protein
MEANYRRVFELEDQDVIFAGLKMHDWDYRADPLGFIKAKLKEYSGM